MRIAELPKAPDQVTLHIVIIPRCRFSPCDQDIINPVFPIFWQDIAGHGPQAALHPVAPDGGFLQFFCSGDAETANTQIVRGGKQDKPLGHPFLVPGANRQKIGPLFKAVQMFQFVFGGMLGLRPL